MCIPYAVAVLVRVQHSCRGGWLSRFESADSLPLHSNDMLGEEGVHGWRAWGILGDSARGQCVWWHGVSLRGMPGGMLGGGGGGGTTARAGHA